MRITQKAVATLAAAVSFTGIAVLNCDTATAAVPVTLSFQVQSDDTNLDEYLGSDVLTRDPSLGYQNWTVTPLDDGSVTIKGTHYGKCIATNGPGKNVTQKPCSQNDLAQRWFLDLTSDTTVIESAKSPEFVLQANGPDRTVTTEYALAAQNQQWTAYQK
ncbi:RICIN domain-containing protein [Kitasatospora sp. NPDC004669]|uniref:RICIN domain-containing protein n=1 Tax=Kitasatospora sp. NPDC004669 TaxID=3154555 RepID=UPI0033A07F3B